MIREVALGLRNAEVARKLIPDRIDLTLYAARVGIIGLHERPR